MDRRTEKTQEAIFQAFFDLLNDRTFQQISVGDIIEAANIGRSTFYNHFSSKDDLITAVCQHLFEHVFLNASYSEHRPEHSNLPLGTINERIAHLFYHFKANDEKVLTLFRLNDDYFLRSLRQQLHTYLTPVIQSHYFVQSHLPDSLIKEHIVSCFLSCLNWWLKEAPDRTAEEVSDYYLTLIA